MDAMQSKKVCKPRRKIRFEDVPTKWDHHRGGWTYAFGTLEELCAPDGILCISAVEEVIFLNKIIDEPWVGFVHQVPHSNYRYYPDLADLVTNEYFLKSLEKCHGLFVLSEVVKKYLLQNLNCKNVPVARLLYPMTPFPDDKKFDWSRFERKATKDVLFIGEFLRNYQAFYDLLVPQGYQKYLLKAPDVDFKRLVDCNKQPITLKTNESVIIRERVSDEEYDELLSCSVVFLNLYDAPANTTVIECLGRNTPIIINRLPGIEEYLGSTYPLLYDTLEEASALLSNKAYLAQASEYLAKLPIKALLTREHFLQSFISSSVYRSLALPPSQRSNPKQTKFPQFDITVVICSYKRVYNLKRLLECFRQQDYRGSFEVVLWNNNLETQAEVAQICAPYMEDLSIRLIQSSENYYCIIRLAVSRLMRSELLLICDDDVVPNSNYISTFVSKFKQYGPKVVLCCRGHVFSQHTLNVEEPQTFWEDYEAMKFFDEKVPDRQIHFVHADNCLIPRPILLQLSSYDLPSPDYILVDDYWMSFVLSHHLRVPLWKIKGDDIFSSTPCAEDKTIALYFNKDVEEQRVNFYVYHMRQGWPASFPLPLC